MSIEYIPKLIIGCCLTDINEDLFPVFQLYQESYRYSFPDFMESEYGMFYIEDEDYVGYVVDSDKGLDLTLAKALELQKLGNKFKSITGVQAKLKACVYKY